jgi:hypothetical protein
VPRGMDCEARATSRNLFISPYLEWEMMDGADIVTYQGQQPRRTCPRRR